MDRGNLKAAFLGGLGLVALGALSPARAEAQAPTHEAAAPSTEEVAEATKHFNNGTLLFDTKDYAGALVEFQASYATVPSPNSRLYIARCFARTGKAAMAHREFDAVIAEAEERAKSEPKYAPTAETARLERDELTPGVGFVNVSITSASEAATLTIGGDEIPRSAWSGPIAADPGDVTLSLAEPGTEPVVKSVSLAPGATESVELSGPSPAPSGDVNRPLRTGAYVAGGVGILSIGIFAITAATSSAALADYDDRCFAPCPELRDDYDSAVSQRTASYVALGLGVAGLTAGVTLFVLSNKGASSSSAKPQGATASLLVGPSYAGVRGTF